MMTYSKKRIEALQERLEQEGLDGLLLATGASFAYLLDMASLPFQRTSETKNQRGAPSIEALNVPDCLLYIPREGEGRIVCVPWRERDLQSAPVPVEVTYLDVFSERMRRHIRGKRIAVGDCCGPWLSEFLKSVAPDIESVPGEKMVEELRRYKDDKEIALLQQAAGMTDAVMGRVVANLKPGVTSYEVEEMLVEFGREAGAEDLAFGPAAMFTRSGHPSAQTLGGCPKDTPLASGCSLAFDFGYVLKGYCSDFGRSFYCGRAPELIRDGYAALQAAQCSMIERLVPGQTNIKDIDGMIRDELTRMGFGEYMTNKEKGVIGHQIGIDCHEMPWMNKFVDFVLQPGMVFCAEPKMWFPGECYMRVEDMILVTGHGAVSLTNYDRAEFELPGFSE